MPKPWSRMSLALLVVAAALLEAAPRSHRPRPLERTPQELAWAAWLRRQEAPPPPRRITTKSLFVFPHLGPEALPACADGYRPDGMGRCVKLVKFDESAHLDFLLQRLNDQFAAETTESLEEDYDYADAAADAEGPFQLSLPLADAEVEGSGEDVTSAAETTTTDAPDTSTSTATDAPTTTEAVAQDELLEQISALKIEAISKLADVSVAESEAPPRPQPESAPLEYWSRGGSSGPQRRRGRPLFD